MGLLKDIGKGLFNTVLQQADGVNKQFEKYYDTYKCLVPQQILREMDKSGNDRNGIIKIKALRKIYTERAEKMNSLELKGITKEAKKKCSANTYNFAQQIYEEISNKRDPWR